MYRTRRGEIHEPVRSDVIRRNGGARFQCPQGIRVILSGSAAESRTYVRPHTGSVMPFIAMSVILLMGTVGIASELTRIFEAVRQLKFAAQSAALYGCSLSASNNNNYSTAVAQANIQNAVLAAGTNAWNIAESGPSGNVFASGTATKGNTIWSSPVTFASTDIQFVPNPLDVSEFFTQVTARRQNADALQQFFLPLLWLYSNPIGSKLPATNYTASPNQTVEVLGQPASRIGAGAPLNQTSNFTGWAALPIAISNQQFAAAANPGQAQTNYIIDLVTPNNKVQPGHIAGCLVNVAAGPGGGNNYYGAGTGSAAVNQLISLLYYFTGNAAQSLTPASIEQGSQLSAFNPSDPNFSNQQAQINRLLAQLPNQYYILPVLANNPSFAGTNPVVGFAWVNISNASTASATMTISQAVPVCNASCIGGYSDVPGNTNNLLPAPVAPFLPRQYDPASGGVTVRPRGVVLAPAVSPRLIKFS